MTNNIKFRQNWDTPLKPILSILFIAFVIIIAVFILPLTIKELNKNQDINISADSIISQPLITPISSSQVVISFSTPTPTTSTLFLDPPTFASTFEISTTPQTSHVITIHNLAPETTYHFYLILDSTDRDPTNSPTYRFTTPN